MFPNQHKYTWTQEQYQACCESEDVFYIKCHAAVFDGNPAIHIVRNGRNAVSSFAKMVNIDVKDAIVMQGANLPGWSAHFWSYRGRNNALMLRFEHLVADPNSAAETIGNFIGKPPKPFENTFEPVNRVMGSGGKHKAILNAEDEGLFQLCHGRVMGVLGYD